MELAIERARRDLSIKELRKLNDVTSVYGLSLSQNDILTLIQARDEALLDAGRVEFGPGVLGKLAYALCDSPFIQKDDYVSALCDMQRLFYFFKKQSMERLTDDELIKAMVDRFNTTCEGSMELLADCDLGKAIK